MEMSGSDLLGRDRVIDNYGMRREFFVCPHCIHLFYSLLHAGTLGVYLGWSSFGDSVPTHLCLYQVSYRHSRTLVSHHFEFSILDNRATQSRHTIYLLNLHNALIRVFLYPVQSPK
jgi:hypothetical protein